MIPSPSTAAVASPSMTVAGRSFPASTVFDVVDPSTGKVVANAPHCSRTQLDEVVTVAREALPSWSRRPIEQRREFLLAMADTIEVHAEELAELITLEQGKPRALAAGEVGGVSYWLRQTALLDLPETVNQDDGTRLSVTWRAPIGVVAALTPWNYPLGQTSFKLGPALLAGNTVVFKPSVHAPLAALRLGELCGDVLPPGVLNVIAGEDELGPWMTAHPGFDMISFTGSTETGKRVAENAARSLSHVTLELGGNDAAIVLPDVDVAEVAPRLFWAAFANSGQICLAVKRLYIHADLYEAMARELCAIARTVRMGDPTARDTELGPVSHRRQYDRVVELLRDSERQGHRFLSGGVPDGKGDGYFIRPTLIDSPPDDARIVREEQFGPVLPLLRYTDLDDAVARANDSEYGLGASVWSRDAEAARQVAERLEAGTVWVNEIMHLDPHVPFGGLKQSGSGVESGLAGLMEFTEARTLTVKRG
ncbi:aldehyde dehydrogenase family protein [Streptomyces sp. DSS69]|uniref:aldehyde dehydrogenase family protein n=1 Tax=unclassified Streptomyces TaxID=2593676 RepID=UPI0031F7A05F